MNPKVQLLQLPPEIKHRINEFIKAQKFLDVVEHLEDELYFWLHGKFEKITQESKLTLNEYLISKYT